MTVLRDRFGVSERRACVLTSQHRSSQRYRRRLLPEEAFLRATADTTTADPLGRAFEAADGARWRAIGGGDTLQDAVAFARASTPEPYSHLIAIGDLYGD